MGVREGVDAQVQLAEPCRAAAGDVSNAIGLVPDRKRRNGCRSVGHVLRIAPAETGETVVPEIADEPRGNHRIDLRRR
jgi:hypothetical protein